MALDATVGGVDSNSYIDVDTADLYHEVRLHNDEWFDASIEKREAALQWATNILDTLDWKGSKATTEQALAWPRSEVYDQSGTLLDSASIPKFLIHALSEYAWELMKGDRLVDSDTKGIKEVQAGEVRVKFDKHDRQTKTPIYVMRLLQPYLHSSFGNFVKVERA